jgi:hypothetical protein
LYEVAFTCVCGELCQSVAQIIGHRHDEYVNRWAPPSPSNSSSSRQSTTEATSTYLPSLTDRGSVCHSEGSSCDGTGIAAHGCDASTSMDANINDFSRSRASSCEPTFGDQNFACGSVEFDAFSSIMRGNTELAAAVGLYRFCNDSTCTIRHYKALRQLCFFDSYPHIPRTLESLEVLVSNYAEAFAGWVTPTNAWADCDADHDFPTPYLSPQKAVTIWLSVPSILEATRRTNYTRLPPNLLDKSLYSQIRGNRVRHGDDYEYSGVADGSWYLNSIENAIPLFEQKVVSAEEEGIEVLVITFGLFQDNFVKGLNSLVQQSLFCLTLSKFLYGRSNFTCNIVLKVEAISVESAAAAGVSSLPVILADKASTKRFGDDAYWQLMIKDLQELQKGRIIVSCVYDLKQLHLGVIYNIQGNRCLIIGTLLKCDILSLILYMNMKVFLLYSLGTHLP